MKNYDNDNNDNNNNNILRKVRRLRIVLTLVKFHQASPDSFAYHHSAVVK